MTLDGQMTEVNLVVSKGALASLQWSEFQRLDRVAHEGNPIGG